MRLSLSVKILGAFFGAIFVLTACNGSPIPELSQDISSQAIQQEEPELSTEIPTEAVQELVAQQEEINPALIEESEGGADMGESNPSPEEQSPNGGYPAPGDGYPAPETGYPAPDEILPTPTLRPADTASDDDPIGNPSPDSGNPPPVKTGLEATDPSTVNLASGGLQFVEFFAFW